MCFLSKLNIFDAKFLEIGDNQLDKSTFKFSKIFGTQPTGILGGGYLDEKRTF